MKRLYNAAATARSAVFCQSRRSAGAAAARRLDPVVRDALAETVQEDAASIDAQLREIDGELEQAVRLLREFESKEQFLGVRTRQYRRALDQQAYELKQEAAAAAAAAEQQGERDEEAALDYEARTEKWEKDTDALETIVKTHTQILAQCEQMRRNIKELEGKKKKIQKMNSECQDFLQEAERQQTAAAAAGDAHENSGNNDDNIEEGRPEESLSRTAGAATPEPCSPALEKSAPVEVEEEKVAERQRQDGNDDDNSMSPPKKDEEVLSSTLEAVEMNKTSDDDDELLHTNDSAKANEPPRAQHETDQEASVEQAEELK